MRTCVYGNYAPACSISFSGPLSLPSGLKGEGNESFSRFQLGNLLLFKKYIEIFYEKSDRCRKPVCILAEKMLIKKV